MDAIQLLAQGGSALLPLSQQDKHITNLVEGSMFLSHKTRFRVLRKVLLQP